MLSGKKKPYSMDAREVHQLIISGEVNTAFEATQLLNPEYNLKINSKSLRRCFKSSGVVSRAKLRKPSLNEQK